MKKHLSITISCEVETGFDESCLAFLKVTMEDLGATVLGLTANTYTCLHTTSVLPDVSPNWQERAVKDAAEGKGIDAQTVVEKTPPTVDNSTKVAVEEPKGGLIDKATLKKALYEVKDKLGTDALLALYEKAAGGAKTLKDVKEADYAGLYSAAQEAINAQ